MKMHETDQNVMKYTYVHKSTIEWEQFIVAYMHT